MIITTIIENITYGKNLLAQHGLSIFIGLGDYKILFDTGQDSSFIKNAKLLNIDLSSINAVIISHGHYDHAGGLKYFCKINPKTKIYLKETFFIPKYNKDNNFIGIKYNKHLYDNRIKIINGLTEIYKNFFIVSDIKIKNQFDTHFEGMKIKKGNRYLEDKFDDELFLVIKKDNKINIVTGCSHRGITNIVETAMNLFNLPINLLLGGFHFKNCDDKDVEIILKDLLKYDIGKIGVCHCTGVEKYPIIKNFFKDRAFYNFTGQSLNI